MKLFIDSNTYIDTSVPLDISLELSNTDKNVIAWYANPPVFEPVRTVEYTGSVVEGGSVNFRNIFFNPHAHGTHTECLGHITETVHSINDTIKDYFFKAVVVSIQPEERIVKGDAKDLVITRRLLEEQLSVKEFDAIVIRTLPNNVDKLTKNYSSSNPAYMDLDCLEVINAAGVKHLLIDLPSVDREEDNGELAFHHAFWNVPNNPRFDRTITELIYVPESVADGEYILELQLASFANDAAPSRPILYKQKRVE